jgi:hypothetical protein
MVLPHHPRPAIPQGEAVRALGGKCCRCLEVLLDWRRLNRGRCQPFYDRLPRPLRAALDQAGETRVRRARARNLHRGPEECPVREEPGFIAHLIERVLGEHLGLPGVTARVVWTPDPWPYGVELRAGTKVVFSDRVDRHWFRSVFARRLAALQGGLTLRLNGLATQAAQAVPGQRGGAVVAFRGRRLRLPPG